MDGKSVISQQISSRFPQINQTFFTQQVQQPVDINSVVQEYAGAPHQIFAFYKQNSKGSQTNEQLLFIAESMLTQFLTRQGLVVSKDIINLKKDHETLLSQLQIMYKLLSSKDSDIDLQDLSRQSCLIQCYLSKICIQKYVEKKISHCQQIIDLCNIQLKVDDKCQFAINFSQIDRVHKNFIDDTFSDQVIAEYEESKQIPVFSNQIREEEIQSNIK